jgi:hypothetical protein
MLLRSTACSPFRLSRFASHRFALRPTFAVRPSVSSSYRAIPTCRDRRGLNPPRKERTMSLSEERIVDDETALPPNRILSAWIGKLQEVVVVGTDSYGKLVVASSASGDRAKELMELAAEEIDRLSDEEAEQAA